MVLQRLDRLTQEEARITAAQTLEVVYGLIQNMRVVMDGEQKQIELVACWALTIFPFRRQGIYGPCYGSARYVSSATQSNETVSDWA